MKKIISIIVLSLVFSHSGFSQDVLDLKEAINYALENKATAVKAQLDVENSDYQIKESLSNALPQISVKGGMTYNALLQKTALTMNGETMVIEMGRPWQSSASVQLNQQLFNMAVFQGLKAAKTTKEFYQINKELTEEKVIEKVANCYFEVFRIQSQIKTVEKTIKNTSQTRDILQSLYENGLSKKIDLDRMNVNLNNLSSQKQQLINSLSKQKNSLKFLIGMDISQKIKLPDDTFEVNPGLALEKGVNYNQLAEIQVLKKQDELLHLNKKVIKAKGYPTLSLTANYGYAGLGDKMPVFAVNHQGVNWSDYSAIGLNLSIPLFTGFNNKAKVQQAQIKIEKNRADLEDTKLSLALANKNARKQVKNSLITLHTQEENVKLSRDVLENVENNYKNGLASLTDLLDAENAYADAQNNYTDAMVNYKLAEIQLVKAKGQLKTFYTN